MKATWVKGDQSAGKPIELDSIVEYMKDAAKAKPVKNMREMIPHCSPGRGSLLPCTCLSQSNVALSGTVAMGSSI